MTTAIFIALLAIIQIPMTFAVGVYRLQSKIFLGQGDDYEILKRIRAHANFTETVPITLLAMGAAEYSGLGSTWLAVGGASLLLGRLAHYYTLRTSVTGNLRAVGMILTFLAMGGFALATLVLQLV